MYHRTVVEVHPNKAEEVLNHPLLQGYTVVGCVASTVSLNLIIILEQKVSSDTRPC